jgi:hypothetical protein
MNAEQAKLVIRLPMNGWRAWAPISISGRKQIRLKKSSHEPTGPVATSHVGRIQARGKMQLIQTYDLSVQGHRGALDENCDHETPNFHLGWGELLCRRPAIHVFGYFTCTFDFIRYA